MTSIVTDLAGRVVSAVSAVGSFYTEINPATLSGAIDIIVVKQPDGSLRCSPFHVRFGKLKLLRPSDKVVELTINGKPCPIQMKVGEAGEAFFVVQVDDPVPSEYATSPIVAAQDPTTDENLDSFQLNDSTLDQGLENLHIGTDYARPEDLVSSPNGTGNDGPFDQTLADRHHFQKAATENNMNQELNSMEGIMIPNKHSQEGIQRQGLDLAQAATSPPWVWNWGGLPQRSTENLYNPAKKEPKLRNRVSTPILKEGPRSTSPEVPIYSVDDKVDTYLASLPDNSEGKVAIYQDLTPENLERIIEGDLETEDQYELLMSQCGPLASFAKLLPDAADKLFYDKIVEYDEFTEGIEILAHPATVFKIHGYYHSWATAAPIIMSQILFKKSLPQATVKKLLEMQPNPQKRTWSWWGGGASQPKKDAKPKSAPNAKSSPSFSATAVQNAKSYAKSLRLTSEQLESLELHDGMNTIEFSVSSGFQGRATCNARIFKWNYDTKIVISDVDGTITKSDVLGHLYTMVGKDWTHEGVANYYTNIKKNGYHFLYLTSRSIGQAGYTRQYLAGVEQDQMQLPDGPVLLSPARLIEAFRREVVERRPQEFKMACLKDVQKLFGDLNPFFAGFGNRITDAMSYNSVNIPSSRIFTIDPSGEVTLELLTNFKTTYKKLTETVDQVFPPTDTNPDYSDFSYWKADHSQYKIDSELESNNDDLKDTKDNIGSTYEIAPEEEDIDIQQQLKNLKQVSY